jgi:hypothetical protein
VTAVGTAKGNGVGSMHPADRRPIGSVDVPGPIPSP